MRFTRRLQTKRTSARWRALSVVLLAGILTVPTFLNTASPAQAVGGTLNLTVESVTPTVKSGEGASFRMQWTCTGSGSCDNATLEVPVPVGVSDSIAFPAGIPLTVTSQSNVNVGAGPIAGSATLVGTAPTQRMVWTFPATVATGNSGTVSFTLLAPNSVTPNGTTITPVATFNSTGSVPVVANADGAELATVQAESSLRVTKQKQSPTDVPYVNQQVTYALMVGYESQFSADTGSGVFASTMPAVCNTTGVQALENLTVVDTLPAGAEFVSASHGGTFDPATNKVTWSLGSSIANAAPYTCVPYSGATTWTGAPMRITVKYPTPTFAANPDPAAVTNSASATANKWGQPGELLSSDSSASHALREGSAGSSVAKSPGYDWAVGAPLYRQVGSGNGYLYYFTGLTSEANPVQWEITDVMPCGLTSPTDPNATNCATPAFTNLTFSADMLLPEIELEYTTNTGATGVCTIPAGTSSSDTTRRFCVGTGTTTPIALPSGQWITKFEVNTEIEAYGGGHIYVHGTPAANVPTENADTVYTNPNLDVDRSDVHPWFVTVENCPVTNQITTADGRVQLAVPQVQTAADNGGICGYRQVMADPFRLSPVKSMYNPALPGTPPTVPSVQTGQTLTVDLTLARTRAGGDSSEVVARSTFTPTASDVLPANLAFVADSLQIVPATTSAAPFVASLGAPRIELTPVTIAGESRQRLTVDFPDADVPPGDTSMANKALVRFQVTVKDGTPAGSYQNDYLLTGEEGGAGNASTYLLCSTGTMVDGDLQPTTDRSQAVGCRATVRYNVLPVAGVKTSKTVQGSYDGETIGAPGVGSTSIGGTANYSIDVTNSGSVDIRNVVAYDVLPAVGDTLTLPGASGTQRNSDFPVKLTGAITAPQGAQVTYSNSANPCRGDLAGTGGGTRASAPAGCVDDWAATPPAGDYGAVTAIRVDFGSRVFAAGETATLQLPTRVVGPDQTVDAARDGIAWNNVAVVAVEASSGRSTLPTEQTPVGLQVIPDLVWEKTDGRTDALLGGSEWLFEAQEGTPASTAGVGSQLPLTVLDCTSAPCSGPDLDAAAGKFRVAGIPWGGYTLTETVAPAGYEALPAPLDVNMTPAQVDRGTFVLDLGAIDNTLVQGEWTLAKTSNPTSGSVVAPGSTISYTLTASNDSDAPVTDVVVMDDLTEVLNNADFVGFTSDDSGLATRADETITWNVGTIEPHSTRTVTYSVTIHEDANGVTIRNAVTGTGTEPPQDCTPEVPCETIHETPGKWSLSKTSDPQSGATVQPGDTVTYTLTAVNASGKDVDDVTVTDDLSDVLNHASFTEFTSDDAGRGARDGNTITWDVGTLAAGETRTLTYAVTLDKDALGIQIRNVVTGTGEIPPEDCTTDEPCETTHETPPEWTLAKTSDPKSGSEVKPGDTVSYTLTAKNPSGAAVNDVRVTDDLTEVLAHASFAKFAGDDNGRATRSGNTITWDVGTLEAGETRTVTYSVTIDKDALGVTIRNVVTGDGEVPPTTCTPEDPCDTTHETPPVWTLAKTSDPKSGSEVKPGDTVTYTLAVSNPSGKTAEGIVVTDDLSDVLDDAAFGQFTNSDGERATRAGNMLTWEVGKLEAGATRIVSYTVTVNKDAHNTTLRNVVIGEGDTPPLSCTADDPCSTTHEVPPTPGTPPAGTPLAGTPLAITGGGSLTLLGIGGAALLLAGGVIALRVYRKRATIGK